MSKALESYYKIDHTLCLNSSGVTGVKPDGTIEQGNILFNIDKDYHIDCVDIDEMVRCLEDIKEEIERKIDGFEVYEVEEGKKNVICRCSNYEMARVVCFSLAATDPNCDTYYFSEIPHGGLIPGGGWWIAYHREGEKVIKTELS